MLTQLDTAKQPKFTTVAEAVYVTMQPVTMKLADGETVTIQPGYEPPLVLPDQIPQAILTAVQNHQDLSIGQFHAVREIDDISWTKNAPKPAGGPVQSASGSGVTTTLRRPMSATGSSADHATYGWYIDGFDSNPNFTGE